MSDELAEVFYGKPEEATYAGLQETRGLMELVVDLMQGNGLKMKEHRHLAEPEDDEDPMCYLCLVEDHVKRVLTTLRAWEMEVLDRIGAEDDE